VASLLYTLEGWPNSPSSDNVARKFDNDSLLWSTVANSPFTGQVVSQDNNKRQTGGWDGSFWYVIGPDGKLYRYNPSANTWSAALFGGVAIIGGTIEDQWWAMTSDGRYVYILASSGDFRRYDPNNDTLSALPTPPGTYGNNIFLTYDGSANIYGSKGDSTGQFYKFTLAGSAWSSIATQGTLTSDIAAGVAPCPAFLGGKLYVVYGFSGTTVKAFQYDPSGNSWTAKATAAAGFAPSPSSRFGEDTDSSIRMWGDNAGDPSFIYNIGTNAWTSAAAHGFTFRQGGNFAVTRKFSSDFTWYLADGVTQASTTPLLGTFVPGQTTTFHYKVKSTSARSLGVTVSVPTIVTSDAEDAVTICATVGGTYGTSFSSAALNAGDFFDVFVKVSPTANQSAVDDKLFNLQIVPN
jgi:hypothetical protein